MPFIRRIPLIQKELSTQLGTLWSILTLFSAQYEMFPSQFEPKMVTDPEKMLLQSCISDSLGPTQMRLSVCCRSGTLIIRSCRGFWVLAFVLPQRNPKRLLQLTAHFCNTGRKFADKTQRHHKSSTDC